MNIGNNDPYMVEDQNSDRNCIMPWLRQAPIDMEYGFEILRCASRIPEGNVFKCSHPTKDCGTCPNGYQALQSWQTHTNG